MKDIGKKIELLCPVCGNDQFESFDENQDDIFDADQEVRFKCSDCGNVFDKEELLRDNAERINIAIEEIKTDAIKEIEKDLKKAFKKVKL